MQNSGTSHLVAISGYNITVIIVALMALLMVFGRRNAFIITLLVTVGFVILTGASASVVRGAIVGLIALFGRVIDRRANQTNLLLLSATIILLLNPLMLLYDYGFLLSFTAFAGLVYISPLFDYLFKKDKFISKIPEFISNVLKETLSAQVMTLPLLLFAFGKFSLVAPLSNVLILPMIPLAMLLTLVVGLGGIISGSVGVFAGYLGWIFLWYPLKVIDFFGNLKISAVDFGKNAFWIVLLGYAVIILIIYKSRRLYKRYVQLF
jgi:competence protein ComEC